MTKHSYFDKLLHGGDYNPEQWLDHPEILKQDIEYFKKAHINEVTIGIFSWSSLEPAEGEYHLEWMEKIIEDMYANGISVILATPTAARPKWMADKYPEVLRVDEYGNRNFFGGRHNHCYTSPVYREKAGKIIRLLSEKFGNHPAVSAWHISNELGGAAHDCFCPLCQEKFRTFLKERYGTIEKVNKAWATTFWSHTYQSFDQIEAPSKRGEAALHGLNLDWRRFVTEQYCDYIRMETQAIREGGSDRPTTINLMYDFIPLNYYKLAETVDIVSWDNYPTWHKKEEQLTAMDSGMQHDIMRSLKKKPFLLMESCPTSTNWQAVSKLKKPGMLHAASLQAVAHGSDSVLYFQLRQSRGSSEKFHGAVIDHYGGDDTRVFREVTEVGYSLDNLQEIVGSDMTAKAAVIYDTECRWASEDSQGPRNAGLHYKETIQKPYSALRKLGLNVDMIDMSRSMEEYKIVAIPMAYMFREGFEEKVRKFVAKGGIAVMTYWSGIVDETDLCFLGGTPHGLMDVAGLRSMEIDGLYDWESNSATPVKQNSLGLEKSYTCKNLCDLVKVSTAETLMTYDSDFYQGMPAMTCNRYGDGKLYYICADFEQGFYDELFQRLAKEAGIHGILENIPSGVEVTMREKDGKEYIFIQNFNREAVDMDLTLDRCEVILGKYNGKIEGLGTIVLKTEKKD